VSPEYDFRTSVILTGVQGYFGSEAAKVKETGVVNIMAPIKLDTPVTIEA
jgi:hypothetical protein